MTSTVYLMAFPMGSDTRTLADFEKKINTAGAVFTFKDLLIEIRTSHIDSYRDYRRLNPEPLRILWLVPIN